MVHPPTLDGGESSCLRHLVQPLRPCHTLRDDDLATVIQTTSPNQRVSLAPGPSEMHFYQIDLVQQEIDNFIWFKIHLSGRLAATVCNLQTS